jgi:hypothetical protein
MSILVLFGINVCMESNKINLKLLNLGQKNKTCIYNTWKRVIVSLWFGSKFDLYNRKMLKSIHI